eukprot:GDKJ01031902.1.p1 GENE.GDKJ01031902.1~~GDKJ01031902.1.p1  ORF type:complete len:496 (+),score=-15.68 GDKJ01031902.1:22-1488(+)
MNIQRGIFAQNQQHLTANTPLYFISTSEKERENLLRMAPPKSDSNNPKNVATAAPFLRLGSATRRSRSAPDAPFSAPTWDITCHSTLPSSTLMEREQPATMYIPEPKSSPSQCDETIGECSAAISSSPPTSLSVCSSPFTEEGEGLVLSPSKDMLPLSFILTPFSPKVTTPKSIVQSTPSDNVESQPNIKSADRSPTSICKVLASQPSSPLNGTARGMSTLVSILSRRSSTNVTLSTNRSKSQPSVVRIDPVVPPPSPFVLSPQALIRAAQRFVPPQYPPLPRGYKSPIDLPSLLPLRSIAPKPDPQMKPYISCSDRQSAMIGNGNRLRLRAASSVLMASTLDRKKQLTPRKDAQHISHQIVAGLTLTKKTLTDCNITGCHLIDCTVSGGYVCGTMFEHCEISKLDYIVSCALAKECQVNLCVTFNSVLVSGQYAQCRMIDSQISEATLRWCRLTRTSMVKCTHKNVEVVGLPHVADTCTDHKTADKK